MDKFYHIENKILKKIIPNNDDKKNLELTIISLKKLINNEIKNKNLPLKIELVGSTAKDTYLKDNLDIDIFLLFPRSFPRIELEKNSLDIGRKLLQNYEESYAEHPYIRGYYKNYKVEIVPCYEIENASQKLSAVDRTPLHTKYIEKHLLNIQKNQVRLLKQFLIGIGCYGAEADVEGFSGYLCEILILKFGTFRNLIENASKWKKGVELSLTIDNNNNFKTPLTFIDPIDDERNVSSALSIDKFNIFILACNNYIKNPSINFFFPNKIEPWSLNKINFEISKQKAFFIGIIFPKPDIIIENLYPQIRKAAKSIMYSTKRYGFKIFDVKYNLDENQKKIFIIIKTDNKPISKSYIHEGPPLDRKKNVDDFILKWKNNLKAIENPYKKNNRIYVELKRDFLDIEEYLKSNILNFSLGKHLDKIEIDRIKIVGIDKLIIDNLRYFWTEYLDGKKPWER